MALSKDEIKTAYPLALYNYKVEVGSDTVAFSEVSGISTSFETTTYRESPIEGGARGPRVMHMPAQRKESTITLKKGIVKGVSLPALYEWFNATENNLTDKKDIYIRLCDETGAAVISWKVLNAFPTKLDAPTFDANSNDAAIETMELMADSVLMEEA